MMCNYLKWCWKLKSVLPWQVSLVSDRELTKDEYEYPASEEGLKVFEDAKKEL